jgi:MtN3 and saliva related transmembrane protein
MSFLYALQIIGGLIMVVGYVPQILQIIRTKSVRDLNIRTFLAICLGISMMEAYAIGLVVYDHTGEAFLITNTLAVVANLTVVVLIIMYRGRSEVEEELSIEEQAVVE